MRILPLLIAGLLFASNSTAAPGPSYSAGGIVNAADNQPGRLAANTIGTLYGSGLAYSTKALAPTDIAGGLLPTVLPGSGVRVLVGGFLAGIYYASPTQINFLAPSMLSPGPSDIQVVIDGVAGPAIPIELAPAAPALFELNGESPAATQPGGAVITPAAPAKPGDSIILYATGLGATTPPAVYLQLAVSAAQIQRLSELQIMLDGAAVDPGDILYAGVAPGFAGLYQINLRLPEWTAADPEIRVSLAGQISRAGLRLPVQR